MRSFRIKAVVPVLALAVLIGGSCGGAPAASGPSPSGADGWVWGEASETDVTLVDAALRAVSTDDVEALDGLYADNATLMVSWDTTSCDRECILDLPSVTPNTYVRVGGVYAVTHHGSGTKLPPGSRYLFFTMVIHGDIFDCWFEVNADSKIVNQWVGWER